MDLKKGIKNIITKNKPIITEPDNIQVPILPLKEDLPPEFDNFEEKKPQNVDMFDVSKVLDGVKAHMNILRQQLKEFESKEQKLSSDAIKIKQEVLTLNQELKQINEIIKPFIIR